MPGARSVRGLAALFLLASTLAVTAASSAAAQDGSGSAVTKTKTVSRYFIDNGRKKIVDKRKVSFTVDQTANLRSLQLVHVSWSGARPTAGIVSDQNSDLAQNEEYSFAIFECRGVDTKSDPLTPNTCWTQYADERFQYGYGDTWPAWRSDAEATTAQRARIVDSPKSVPDGCTSPLFGTQTQRWVPFVGADMTVYPGGIFGCGGLPPEASPANLSSLSLPSNETYGVTGLDGKGSADFDVFSGEDHASLGCSQNVPCSLVAVPIMGVSCDAAGTQLPAAMQPKPNQLADATATCESTGVYQPGDQFRAQQSGASAVDGSLWWSPSNWANRISIPLSFAPADNVCGLNSSARVIDIYGSELMTQATTQWAPSFCLDPKLFDLGHVQTPEPQARNLLATNNVDAAYTSEPPDSESPYPNPTVNAPVAVTGFGIAFAVDDNDGQPVTTLRLDARLLAKLLTESYPSQLFVQQNDPALQNNPLNITYDPEFQALNPNIPAKLRDTAATLLTLSSDSDLVYALTQYIDADPEARAWLDGKPDPWGMTVNPNYKGIRLPVDNWPLLDTFEPRAYYDSGVNPCLEGNQVPYLPLVASPTSRLFSIGQDMQFAIAQSQTTCQTNPIDPTNPVGSKLVANGRQSAGARFMLGTVSLGDAAREGLPLASLESTSSVDPSTQITDATGRTFVAPTTDSLRAAAQLLTPDHHTGTWPIRYQAMRGQADAYPGTMVVYAAVPTKGLPSGDGPALGKFLDFAAGRGQQPGTQQGDLPGGFLPMTKANGLGAMVTYTQCAASAVAAQQGKLPQLTGGCPVTPQHHQSSSSGPPSSTSPSTSTSTPINTPTGSQSTPVSGPGGGAPVPGGAVPGGGSVPAGTNPTDEPTGSAASSGAPARGSGSTAPGTEPPTSQVAALTPAQDSSLSGLAVPVVLGVALVAGLAAAAMRVRPRGRRRM